MTDKPQTAVAKRSPFDDFKEQLDQRANEIALMLPGTVTKEKFMAAASAAIKQNPDLLNCTPRSLFTAITKAAQDGMLPDGREGVINSYNTKVKRDGKDVYETQAQWNPMTHGLRKRARELDGILIDAQVVHENDHFLWRQGDAPGIDHVPAKLGTARGAMIGVYAIFKRENGVILGREVMDKDQVEMVRNQSKAKDSLMWKQFVSEGWRKSVIRRGIKAVPVSENLESIVRRDDENFDFENAPPKPRPSEFVQERTNPALGDWTAKVNFANSIGEVADLRKAGLVALPPDLHGRFNETCDNRARQIGDAPHVSQAALDQVDRQEEQRSELAAENEAVDEALDHQDTVADQNPTETPFQRGARLLAIITVPGDVTELFASVKEELASKKDRDLWKGTCEARFKELGGVGKMKTAP